jgi:hypothetical protein
MIVATWHTAESARDEWSPSITDDRLTSLLEISREVCAMYAPELENDAAVPERYRLAQIMYARETLNAAQVSPSGAYDPNSFAASPFPLSWKIKGLLRPQRGVPAIG